jgi:hypothetical protein
MNSAPLLTPLLLFTNIRNDPSIDTFHGYHLFNHLLNRVYLLVRTSGNTTLQDRLKNEIASSKIFDTLRSQFATEQEFQEKVVKKIVPIHGDIMMDQLGISNEDLATIQADTGVVINSAASVSFDDPLESALEVSFDILFLGFFFGYCVYLSEGFEEVRK